MLIRHEECYTICEKLTVKDLNNKIIYKPSCYYVYRPCDSSVSSINEVRDNFGEYQDEKRLMTSDIIKGYDEVGCTLFFKNGDIYWVGSLLDIEEARLLYDNQYNHIINSTIVQVLAGYISGLFYLIESIEKHHYRGLLSAEDLPIKKILQWSRPLLGPFGIIKVEDWNLGNKNKTKTDLWQFNDFMV